MVPDRGSSLTPSGQEVPAGGASTSAALSGANVSGAIPGSVEEQRQAGAGLGGDGGTGAAGETSEADETRRDRETSESDADADRRRRNEGDLGGASAFDETESERRERVARQTGDNTGKPPTLMDDANRTESAAGRSTRLAREKDQGGAAADPNTAAARNEADKIQRTAPTPGLSDARTSPGAAAAPVVGGDQAAHRRQAYGAQLKALRDNLRHDFAGHSHLEDVLKELTDVDAMVARLIEDNTSR